MDTDGNPWMQPNGAYKRFLVAAIVQEAPDAQSAISTTSRRYFISCREVDPDFGVGEFSEREPP
jgi:hypothetical protein